MGHSGWQASATAACSGEGSETFCKCGAMTALVSNLVSVVSGISLRRARRGRSLPCCKENDSRKTKNSSQIMRKITSMTISRLICLAVIFFCICSGPLPPCTGLLPLCLICQKLSSVNMGFLSSAQAANVQERWNRLKVNGVFRGF